MLVAGVDVGQSSTTAAIADANGDELGRGVAGPGDEVGEDERSTRLSDAITAALEAALTSAGLPLDSTFATVVAGISGYEGVIYGRTPTPHGARFFPMHDTVTAHAGAFEGGPGVLAIAGTGSAVYASDGSGHGLLLGGFGYLFGDEGSAFALARGAVMDACAEEDRGAARSALTRALLDRFSSSSARALVRAFYAGGITRAALAGFAPHILAMAENGIDAGAVALVEQAAISLAVLGATAARRAQLVPAPFAVTGGLMASPWFAERIDGAIGDLDLPLERVAPGRDPVAGALLLAQRQAQSA